MLLSLLPDIARRVLMQIAAASAARSWRTMLVGGTVRDLLLGLPGGDLDVVIEGDAIALAESLAAAHHGEALTHAAFGTAVLTLPTEAGPLSVDLITARSERYAAPATLPIVQPGTLSDDLLRRDFTINTLALLLDAGGEQVIDVCGGRADLSAGVLRVLHTGSFVDDPTRILRGVRLAARLSADTGRAFSFDPDTAAFARAALEAGMFERTSPQRLVNELVLLLHEPAPERAILLLDALGALPHLGLPGWHPAQTAQFVQARQAAFADAELDHVLVALALLPHPAAVHAALIERYRPTIAMTKLIRSLAPAQAALATLAAAPPSRVEQTLAAYPLATVRALQIAADAPLAAQAAHYCDILRHTAPLLTGDDLRRLGYAPGPQFRTLLAAVRAAQLDGRIATRAAAEAWLRESSGNSV